MASTLEDQAQRLNRLKALLLDQASKQANVSPGEFFTHSQFRGDEPTDAPRPFSEFRHGVTQDELPAETICAIWSDVSRLFADVANNLFFDLGKNRQKETIPLCKKFEQAHRL